MGAEREYNSALKMGVDRFPLALLAPEERQTTAVDVSITPQTWLDRLFDQTAAPAPRWFRSGAFSLVSQASRSLQQALARRSLTRAAQQQQRLGPSALRK